MAIPEPTSGLLGLWREQSLWSRTAMATHVAAGRYEFQLIEFLRTAERLTQLATAARSAVPEAAAELAAKAEEVISVENQGWMAKLEEDLPAQQAPADASNVESPGE
jgi:hypothetical protein